jgi:hypothetical protein
LSQCLATGVRRAHGSIHFIARHLGVRVFQLPPQPPLSAQSVSALLAHGGQEHSNMSDAAARAAAPIKGDRGYCWHYHLARTDLGPLYSMAHGTQCIISTVMHSLTTQSLEKVLWAPSSFRSYLPRRRIIRRRENKNNKHTHTHTHTLFCFLFFCFFLCYGREHTAIAGHPRWHPRTPPPAPTVPSQLQRVRGAEPPVPHWHGKP